MNYCILNGINSNTITGLLIQSLPPISKPLMRTQIETIDGRDGDIITKLGYSAYDKDMEIGLYGSFDINQIIKFFDSDGIVTFSNEPDKFYKYEIVNQIDFERLIKFRTAKVTFHVQPFKYEVDELGVILTSSGKTVTNKGNIYSKPIFTISGEGTINLLLNGAQIFTIELGDEGYITIDSDKLEAYKDGVLKNRLVTGNYDNLKLNVGVNTIGWTGTVSQISVERYSRWI